MMGELPEGTLIDDRYVVISRIGSGGMADVYCAADQQLGRNVAVKVLHERFAQDQEFVERFRREASSAAGLNHPNVVSVFDRGEWDGTYYIAMEYLGGRSMKQLVRERGPLPPAEAIELAEQVLRAARFAHQHGVVHRDLKPLNVIVDDEGRVKVTDFGIARAGASEITQTGSIMGTAQYLSPEQAQGHAVSPRSDLYSIGILLYELLTGRVPFEGDSAVTIALKQISEAPPVPSAVNGAVSPQLDAIVARALAKDPDHRFADADEFLAALSAERERLRLEGGGRTAEFVAPVAADELAYADQAYPEEAYAWEPLAPPEPRDRGPLWTWIAGLLLVAGAVAVALVLLLGGSKQRVPNVVGQTESAALTRLQAAGFLPVPTHVIDPAQQGLVISQTPAGSASASKGSVVRLVVAEGLGTAQVPDLSGRSLRAARAALVKAGFKVSTIQTQSDTVAAGRVIDTNPPALTPLQVGSQVALNVSTGPQKVTVPSVVGKNEADATSILSSTGFQVTSAQQESTQPAGTVLSQSPAAGARAAKNATVRLTIAKAATQATVPDVTGRSQVDASSALAAAGFNVRTTYRTVGDQSQDGVVIAQNPGGGRAAKAGSRVHIVIGRFAAGQTTTPTTPAPATKP